MLTVSTTQEEVPVSVWDLAVVQSAATGPSVRSVCHTGNLGPQVVAPGGLTQDPAPSSSLLDSRHPFPGKMRGSIWMTLEQRPNAKRTRLARLYGTRLSGFP